MGALHGAANAAIMGGDIGEGAEFGAVGSVMNNLFGPIIGGGITSELSGGKFSAGAREGAYGVAASVAMSVAMQQIADWNNRTTVAVSNAMGSVNNAIGPPRMLNSQTVDELTRPTDNIFARTTGWPRHSLTVYDNGNSLFELEPQNGNVQFNDIRHESKAVQKYYHDWQGQLKSVKVKVNPFLFRHAISEQMKRTGEPYRFYHQNSNYTIRKVIHDSGGRTNGDLGYAP